MNNTKIEFNNNIVPSENINVNISENNLSDNLNNLNLKNEKLHKFKFCFDLNSLDVCPTDFPYIYRNTCNQKIS